MLNQEFDSDTSDEDYVPKGADEEEEDDFDENDVNDETVDDGDNTKNKGKSKSNKSGKLVGRRKANPLLSELEESAENKDPSLSEETERSNSETSKNSDNLWADFLSDVNDDMAPKPKAKGNTWAEVLGKKKSASKPNDTVTECVKPKEKPNSCSKLGDQPVVIKIKKMYEFAGELVEVEKEVAADSAEAKNASKSDSFSKSQEISSSPLSGPVKRPGGLSSVMNMIESKKKKLTTLEKTKLDWDSFKSKEGLMEELESHKKSKGGYLERKEFLERADFREYEIERDIRMSKRAANR